MQAVFYHMHGSVDDAHNQAEHCVPCCIKEDTLTAYCSLVSHLVALALGKHVTGEIIQSQLDHHMSNINEIRMMQASPLIIIVKIYAYLWDGKAKLWRSDQLNDK